MKILTVKDIQKLIRIIGLSAFFKLTIAALKKDFGRWHDFSLAPRVAHYYPHGVIELMPCSDQHLYSFKYVNGHPGNPINGKLSVAAIGMLIDVASGYPMMISEMTLLTALRTAATSVLAALYLSRRDAETLAIIGSGAQAEFQAQAFAGFFNVKEVRFFDNDAEAMSKFARNLSGQHFKLTPFATITTEVYEADIIITATAAKKRQSLMNMADIAPGTFINAIGGDCPGKTELSVEFLKHVKLVVEYSPQSLIEGEVQQVGADFIYAELWELVGGIKPGRENQLEITLFDSVGFALEDFSILRVVYELAKQYQLGTDLPLIPDLEDPKDLYGLLTSP